MEKVFIVKKPAARVWTVLMITCITNLVSMANGFGLAYPSPIANHIQKKGLLDMHTFPIFASIYLYASILGPVINYPLMNLVSRKTIILLSTIPSVMGWILIIVGTSASWLIVGRGLTGIGTGMVLVLVPIYIGEISEAKSRGFFTSMIMLFMVIGVSVSYGAGILLPYTWLAVIPICILVIMSAGLIFLPYSPVWLTQKGCKTTALNTLEYLRGKTYNIDEEYSMIVDAVDSSHSVTVREKIAYFSKPHAIRVILVSIGITMLYHFSGVILNTNYASLFLRNINVLTPNVAVFLISLFVPFGNCLYSVLTDKVGRKFLLCVSLAVLLLGNLGFSTYFYLVTYVFPQCGASNTHQTIPCSTSTYHICSYLSIIPIVSLLIMITSFSLGLGSIAFTYIGELFPVRVKSLGANLTVLANRTIGGTVILLFPYYAQYAGTYVAFLTLAVILFISIPMVILFVPETKRKSIAEIEELFKDKCLHIC